jgi:hypothetical protein
VGPGWLLRRQPSPPGLQSRHLRQALWWLLNLPGLRLHLNLPGLM